MTTAFFAPSTYLPQEAFSAYGLIRQSPFSGKGVVRSYGLLLSLGHEDDNKPPCVPVFVNRSNLGVISTDSPVDFEIRSALEDLTLDIVGSDYSPYIWCETWGDILPAITANHGFCGAGDYLKALGVDIVYDAVGALLVNPDVIGSVESPFFRKEETGLRKEAEALTKPEASSLRKVLSSVGVDHRIRLIQDTTSPSKSQMFYGRSPCGQGFFEKQAGTDGGTVEEFLAFRVAQALGARAPEVVLLNRGGFPALVTQEIEVSPSSVAQSTTPYEDYKMNRDCEGQGLYAVVMDHQDFAGYNIISSPEGSVVIDMGGALRVHPTGTPKEFEVDDGSFFLHFKKHTDGFPLLGCGCLPLEEKIAILSGMKVRMPQVHAALRQASHEIMAAGLTGFVWNPEALKGGIADVIERRIDMAERRLSRHYDLLQGYREQFAPRG